MKLLTFITISLLLISACKKDESETIDIKDYPEYFKDKVVFDIINVGNSTYYSSSQICTSCEVPLWQSSIPMNYQLCELSNNDFNIKEDYSFTSELISYQTNRLLYTSGHKVFVVNSASNHEELFSLDDQEFIITDISIDKDGNFWMTGPEGIAYYDAEDFSYYNMENSVLLSNEIHHVEIDKNSDTKYFVLGSPYWGMLIIKDGVWEMVTSNEITGVEGTLFYDLTIDDQGNLWFLSSPYYKSNIYVYNGTDWSKIIPQINGAEKTVWVGNIKRVEDGTMWIVSNNKSLFSYKDNAWTFYGEENFTNRVLCLEEVDNKIILGTDKGLEFLE